MNRAGMLIALAAVAMFVTAPGAQTRAEVALRAAVELETVKGDLRGAIEAYKKIADDMKVERVVRAQALLRLAAAYQKLGDAQARTVYERIVRDFPEQQSAVAAARAGLAPGGKAANGDFLIRRVDTSSLGAESISRDGARVAFTEFDDDNIAVRELGSDRAIMVTSAPAVAPGGVIEFGESPVFSPDGSQVAYTWCTKAGRNCLGYLRIARVPTGPPQTPRVLYAHGDWTRAYDWSPDAKQLAVVITRSTNVREIALLSTADGSKRVLREIADGRLPRRMLFSPDGKYLAYDDGATTAVPVAWNRRRSEVHVIDVAGGEPRLISADAAHSLVAGWSPDGRRLVFTADSGGTMDLYAAEMVNGRPAGRPVLIRSDLGAVAPLGMSRSGTFFYQVRSGGGTHLEQAVFDFTKGEFVKAPAPVAELTPTGDMPPQWSPDGKWLAYHYQRNATPQSKSSVVVRSASGDDLREIKTDFTINRRLLWSADGRSLYAIGVDAQGVDGLFAVDVRSGGSTRLAGDAPGSTPLDRLSNLHVNKRGTHAYFTRSRGPRHHVVQFDLTTLDEKELFAFDSVGNPPPPAFAPDGSKAFYRRWMRPVPGTRGVDILLERDLRSGAERELHKGIVTWALLSPDGRHLAVRLGDVGNKWNSIAVFPTSGDAVPRELMRDEGPAGLFILAWSPDSASLLINRPAKEGAGREAWWLPLNGEAKRVDRRIANMSIHPDGRRVALVRAGEPRRSEIWAMERFLPAK